MLRSKCASFTSCCLIMTPQGVDRFASSTNRARIICIHNLSSRPLNFRPRLNCSFCVPRKEKLPVDAYNKGIELLARREHSSRELKLKLARRGVEKYEVDSVLEQLQSKDFQNDARFGEMLVRTRIESGYGPRWIVAELQTHGIGESKARELIDEAGPDWTERVRDQLRRRYGGRKPANLAERAKRANFLLRRGFDAATVQSVTRAEGLDSSADELD